MTLNSAPAPATAIVVTGPDGANSGGTTNEAGDYTIPDPPKGALTFHFIPAERIPPEYTRPGNGLAFEYSGGGQKHDIDLK